MFKRRINRTTYQEGYEYRVYPKIAPMFYKTPDGTYEDIDHTFNDTTSSIGDISLMDKGVVSVGIRKGNNPYKVVGIRPDSNQHLGTQQLEFSLVNVELDGVSQSFNVETDLKVMLKRSRVFQLVKLNAPSSSFSDCKIEFDIHNTGLELQNKKYSETTTIRDYGFNLTNIGENNGNTTLALHNNYSRLNKDIPYFDFYVGKITDEYITTGEYTNEEEFGDSDLSDYVINGDMYPNGSAVYYKDSIIFTIQCYNIENYKDIIINNLCDMYGLENFDDGGSGKYLTKDGKKVIGYIVYNNVFFGFINTVDIPDKIKTLFKRKSFEDTSFLNLELSDFCTDISNKFNKDLKIEVDNTYFKPINDNFYFKVSNECFVISEPLAFDDLSILTDYQTTHTLKDNGDGSYRYTKLLKIKSALNINNAKYLDVNLYSSDASDAGYYKTENVQRTSARLTQHRNATSGSRTIQTNSNYGIRACGQFGTRVSSGGQFGSTFTYTNGTYQYLFQFDTSNVVGTVTNANLRLRAAYETVGGSHNDISIILLKSAANTNVESLGNLNSYLGHTAGWSASDVTEYSAEYVVDGYEDSLNGVNMNSYATELVPLNATALTDMKNNDTFQFFIVEYDEFYLDSYDSTYGQSATGERTMYSGQIDATNSNHVPYISFYFDVFGHDVTNVPSGSIDTISTTHTTTISKLTNVSR